MTEELITRKNSMKAMTLGVHSAVVNGMIDNDIPSRVVFVSSETELELVAYYEPVGTIAIQFGFKNIWQLKPDKTWELV